jgi:hypothetical protein
MKRTWCERESDVVEALRSGSFSDELREHVGGCAMCAEAEPVAKMLLQAASVLHRQNEPPPAGLVWRRAQAQKRELALKRAARPLIFMRALSGVYTVLFAVWLLHYFLNSGLMEKVSGWNGMQSETAYFGTAIAVLAIAIGAWFLLHDGRSSGESVPSI